MAKYYFTKKTVSDLAGIWEYTCHEWSERQADKYYKMLIENCRDIAKDPGVGKPYPGISENLFGFKSGRHIIFYRILDVELEITRILHEKMDLKSRIS